MQTAADLHAVVEGASSRETAIADLFVVLADALVEDYDIVDLLDQLVRACMGLLDLDGAGLLLLDGGGLEVVASSSAKARQLKAFEVEHDEGPCVDSFRTGAPVISSDLRADHARWPTFVPASLAAGFRSVVAVPLRLRSETIGALGLFPRDSSMIGDADRRLAQAFAAVATIGILQRRSSEEHTTLTAQLQHAVNSHRTVEQAKGVLAERHKVSPDAAFDSLRRHARSHNSKLHDIANAIINGEFDPGSDVRLSGPETT